MTYSLLFIPLLGILIITTNYLKKSDIRYIGLLISILNLILSLIIFILFDFSNIDYQYIQEIKEFYGLNIYIGIDGISIYFILLTTLIMPLVLLSN
jgi:NADH:ubiquinone oxidoreductase subunit 4 (subunit M)